MAVIVGIVIALGAIFGGFALDGGHLAALFQPYELLMIGGGAVGAFVIGNDAKSRQAVFDALPTLFHTQRQTRALYLDLMTLMFELLTKVRREGLMAVEDDVDNPAASPIFYKYPLVMADPHLIEFITDYLRLIITGNIDVYQIDNLMDNEIEVHHQDGQLAIIAINKVAEALPAFG